jgi:citrate lyase subunit beta / citryl-CoA lyase
MPFMPPGPGWLFCPADRPDRYHKAAASADVVILDLEDAVALANKEAARAALIGTALDPARTVIRVNPAGTEEHSRDLAALSRTAYTTVMLPKSEAGYQVAALAPRMVIVLIETPLGALNVADCVRQRNAIGVMWGSEDLFAALGGTANRRADGTLRDVAQHVRSASLLAAKAYHKLALDSVFLDIKDLDGLRAEVDDAFAVGFDAKVAIHPSQVPVIRAGYAPDAEQIAWARRVLDVARNSRGVFELDGKMIDVPVLRRAESILRLANARSGADG